MTEREKVLKGLEHCSTDKACRECVYYGVRCIDKMCADALKLLKEQPEQKHGHWMIGPKSGRWICSCCGYAPTVFEGSQYCPDCGALMDEKVTQDA